MKLYWSRGMKYITAQNDYGEKETFERWNGKSYDASNLDQIITVTEDTIICRPGGTLGGEGVPLGYVKVNAITDDSVKDVLYEIDEVSTMRANAALPIDPEEMKKKGMVEGVDYKLRTPNSYHVRTKSGKFGMIAYANEITSIMIGAKRGRFTGSMSIAHPDKWERLKPLCDQVEIAFKEIAPEVYKRQIAFAEQSILPEYRHGPFTTASANRYSEKDSLEMGVHSDGRDSGMTTISIFREGAFSGGLFCWPRFGIGLDLPSHSVAVLESKELHCATKVSGSGTRYSTVLYQDISVATKSNVGKSERKIGRFAKEESGNLEEFFS